MKRATGAILPLVLLALLVIAAASFALSFKVTLDALAARSALSAALAHAQAAGGLALAVAEHDAAREDGREPPPELGPWPALGIVATVEVTPAGFIDSPGPDDASDPEPAVTLVATATVGRATATSEVTLVFLPTLRVLSRR
jgi:hypothetical protein